MVSKNRLLLGVNIDHVATLREARGTRYPDPVQAAIEVEQAGADGITVHLREDRRHIQDRDLDMLKEVIQTRMNLEIAVTDEMIGIAQRISPAHVCLVPEKREELTTEGGLDVISQEKRIATACQQLGDAGIQVSLFIDPEPRQIEAALRCGAPAIEIHTGAYADACEANMAAELQRVIEGVDFASRQGLIVNAGHGLNYHNVESVAAIPGLNELNIGHSLIARALFNGIKESVVEMKRLMLEAQRFSSAPER